MAVRAMDTLPEHWKYISEGGATMVFSYSGPPNAQFDGMVMRLRKTSLFAVFSQAAKMDPQDEPDDPIIEFQQKCIERLIPMNHLPRLASVYLTREWLEALVHLHDAERPKGRRDKDQVDLTRCKGVLATDLVGGNHLSIEIKPKWAFLPSPTHLSDTTRGVKSRTCRFCMHSAIRSKTGETVSSGYCPLDLFSGDKNRVRKAIYNLWDAWNESNATVNNLKIFVCGEKIIPSEAYRMLSSAVDVQLSEDLREVFADALLPPLMETPVLQIIYTLQRSLDALDIEGLSRLVHQVELAQLNSSENDNASPRFSPIDVNSAYLTFTEPTIPDWNEFLDIYLSASPEKDLNNPGTDDLRYYLLAYILSATFKDCSIIIRLDRLRLTEPAQSIKLEQVTVIDLDPKGMDRLGKWEKLDQEIVTAYIAADGHKVCVDARRTN